jgi:hypothetical protein
VRQGRGGLSLLQTLTDVYKSMDHLAGGAQGHVRIVREDHENSEEFSGRAWKMLPSGVTAILRKKLRSWVLTALAKWCRTNAEEFARAAAHPDAGVTIRVRLTSVPGLDLLGGASNVLHGVGGVVSSALRGTPNITISVDPGRQRK